MRRYEEPPRAAISRYLRCDEHIVDVSSGGQDALALRESLGEIGESSR